MKYDLHLTIAANRLRVVFAYCDDLAKIVEDTKGLVIRVVYILTAEEYNIR